MRRTILLVTSLATALLVYVPVAGAASAPTGERVFHQASIEPAYDAASGNLGFLLTPMHAPDPVKANSKSWAPIYLPVYPTTSTVSTPLNCMHTPAENCPSHGDGVADAAQQISAANGFGSVYAAASSDMTIWPISQAATTSTSLGSRYSCCSRAQPRRTRSC